MKVSDYVIKFLENCGVKDLFLLSGGGIMHLLDSVNSSTVINKYYNLNEQASSFCADSYAQASGKLGVCMVTTGPGATNAITGVASGHIDSSPILVISGQVRTNSMVGKSGARQIGAQEVNIIPMVESITKYAVTVMDAKSIRFHLEKAVHLATHGRKGAVWLDIPLDIQAQQIEPDSLESFVCKDEPHEINALEIAKLYQMIRKAKRPVILAGSGVFLADAVEQFVELVNLVNIPVLSSVKFRRIASKLKDDIYYGTPGSVAARYSNYILQNSDLLIVMGCGLRYYMTAFDDENFAPNARKVMINIDETELKKLKMNIDLEICNDVKFFINQFLKNSDEYIHNDIEEWLRYCEKMKKKYPVYQEVEKHLPKMLNSWTIEKSLAGRLKSDDVINTVSVSNCILPFYCDFIPRYEQELVQTIGLGSMGHGIPSVIATCIALAMRRTIIFEGDGSLQHNIQELALIKQYNLPIKLFIENNSGYSQIYGMQQNHFKGRLAGCNAESGVQFPDLKKIAEAYGIEYSSIKTIEEINSKIDDVLKDDRPIICEFFTQIDLPGLLTVKSRVLANGQMATSSLEDLYPFLPEEEHKQNMISVK